MRIPLVKIVLASLLMPLALAAQQLVTGVD